MEIFDIMQPLSRYDLDVNFSSTLHISGGQHTIHVEENSTAYGFVHQGDLTVSIDGTSQRLREGMYFSIPGPAELSPFVGLICIRNGFKGFLSFGGPVERLGRLKYIDGCSDSLLISPPLKGDPCLNYLYVPPRLNQTAHTHPSVRIGIVIEGAGYCLTEKSKTDLIAGGIFLLPTDEIHSFHTDDTPLRIVVYHPDSDFGPTHEAHPMINRTWVDGISLAGENRYRTRQINEFGTE
ncbi:hypothetical protein Xekk_01482 [Xenorhabdus sp. KK7.4]|nr:hypothetical protein Xekk_01482 [Xenorhabdus sp. KK7.4]